MAPARTMPASYMVQELSVPKALLRAGPYTCRDEQDKRAEALDKKPFNNATKLNKYGRS
jgi:hypothetical protein